MLCVSSAFCWISIWKKYCFRCSTAFFCWTFFNNIFLCLNFLNQSDQRFCSTRLHSSLHFKLWRHRIYKHVRDWIWDGCLVLNVNNEYFSDTNQSEEPSQEYLRRKSYEHFMLFLSLKTTNRILVQVNHVNWLMRKKISDFPNFCAFLLFVKIGNWKSYSYICHRIYNAIHFNCTFSGWLMKLWP